MARYTNAEFAQRLAAQMALFKANTINQATLETNLTGILTGWINFGGAVSDAAAAAAEAIADGNLLREQLADWVAGTATGGPNNDGRYPFTIALGLPDQETTFLIKCPARLVADNAAEITAFNAAWNALVASQIAAGAVMNSANYNLDAVGRTAYEDDAARYLGAWLYHRTVRLGRPMPSQAQLICWFNLFTALVESGVFAKMDALYIFAQDDQTSSLINIISPTGNTDLIPTGGGGSTPGNWVAYKGWQGGIVNSAWRLQTPNGALYPGTSVATDGSIFAYVTEAPTRGIYLYTGSSRIGFASATAAGLRINQSSGNFNMTGATGFISASRDNADNVRSYHDDDAELVTARASPVASTILTIGGIASGGSESDVRLGAAGVGKSLTVGQTGALQKALDIFFRDMARAS